MTDEDAKAYVHMIGQNLQTASAMSEVLIAENGVIMLLDRAKPEGRVDIDAYIGYLSGDGPPTQRYHAINDYFVGEGTALRSAIAQITEREGLPESWFSDALTALFSSPHSSTKWLEYAGLRIYIAPTEYVLTMKIAACAGPQDSQDAIILAQKLHLTTTEELIAIITRYIPKSSITPEMRRLIEQLATDIEMEES